MSILLHLKGVVISNMKDEIPGLKQATLDLINNIDSDLDGIEQTYDEIEWSDETQKALAAFDKVLVGEEESPYINKDNEEDIVETDRLEGLGDVDDENKN